MTSHRPAKRAVRANEAALGLDLTEIETRLRRGEGVRRTLTPWGRLHIDRPLPFLCVYRRPAGSTDPLSEQLVTSEPSYLLAPGDRHLSRDVARVAQVVTGALELDFGACLIVEVSLQPVGNPDEREDAPPVFSIVRPRGDCPGRAIDELENALNRIVLEEFPVGAEVRAATHVSAHGLQPLLRGEGADANCFVIGVEIAPVYLDTKKEGRDFPLVHRRLRKGLSRALKLAAFEFTKEYTTHRPPHYHALGRRSLVKAVWDVDKRLAGVSNRFDVLLLTTPRNTEQAWQEFRRSRFEKAPHFSYRPLPFDPALAKRELYAIPIERIEDPTLADLFREQQDELDRKISMVDDRGTPRFRHDSQKLFGGVTDILLRQATDMLDKIPSRTRAGSGKPLDARAFATRAEAELQFLRESYPALHARVQIRRDVSGLMVSRGNLLIARHTKVPAGRVDALLQHEIGTHIVTYYNGDAQPFRQLRNGLPGYEELQEGLAVLAEFLVGGLSRARLRLLAARVLSVRMMLDGASFVEVFRELDRGQDFERRSAYTTTMRVFRGGGQAKDAVYLRGLAALLKHLGSGGKLEPLLVGKIGLHHLAIVNELKHREVMVPPPLRPRYLSEPASNARLARLREGVQVIDLADS